MLVKAECPGFVKRIQNEYSWRLGVCTLIYNSTIGWTATGITITIANSYIKEKASNSTAALQQVFFFCGGA